MLKYFVKTQVWIATARHKAESGQSLAEYGLVLALIAVICITALSTLGNNLATKMNCLAAAMFTGNRVNAIC